MLDQILLAAAALAAVLALPAALAQTGQAPAMKYPSLGRVVEARAGPPGVMGSLPRPPGLGQQAPLTPEYQAVLEANLAKTKAGTSSTSRARAARSGCHGSWCSMSRSRSFSGRTRPTCWSNPSARSAASTPTAATGQRGGCQAQFQRLFHRRVVRHRQRRHHDRLRSRPATPRGRAHGIHRHPARTRITKRW